MIGYLRGEIVERRTVGDSSVELVVDVRGVGYRVLVTPRVAAGIAMTLTEAVRAVSAPEVSLSVHTHVREGAITLYGFGDAEERRAFEILLTAHGVGPALALAIVAVHEPARLVGIVTGDDVDALMLVPGVGRKTALRLLIDLKARFSELDGAAATSPALGGARQATTSDVAEALAQLGYGPDEVRTVLRRLPSEGSTEELLRAALHELAPRR
jgi:Holliday junction DNA helicase RuvA